MAAWCIWFSFWLFNAYMEFRFHTSHQMMVTRDIKRSDAPSVHIVCLMSWTMHEVCNTFWSMSPLSLEAKTPLFPVPSDSLNTPYPSDSHLCIFCNLVVLHRPRLCLCHFLSCLWKLIHSWRCSSCCWYSSSFSCSLRRWEYGVHSSFNYIYTYIYIHIYIYIYIYTYIYNIYIYAHPPKIHLLQPCICDCFICSSTSIIYRPIWYHLLSRNQNKIIGLLRGGFQGEGFP